MATISDAIRRAKTDHAFAKDFAEHPEKYAAEYNLTPEIMTKVKAAAAHFSPTLASRRSEIHYYG